MSKQTKKIGISGLAFLEEFDMWRLEKAAKDGWVVTKFGLFNYILERQDPQDLQYVIDYKDQPDEEYVDIFHAAGWTLVDSLDYIHLFKAPSGVTVPHTSVDTKLEKMMHEMRRYGRYTMGAIVALLAAVWLNIFAESSNMSWLSPLSFVLLSVVLVVAVFLILPFFGYWYRAGKLKKMKV
jgi:hypothetical protein